MTGLLQHELCEAVTCAACLLSGLDMVQGKPEVAPLPRKPLRWLHLHGGSDVIAIMHVAAEMSLAHMTVLRL